MIDRQSPVPVYYQIERYIEKLIETNDLKEGDRVPSEKEFTDRFQVSRMTVRQAVMDLVNAGVLIRQKGKGTFVAGQRKIEKQLSGLNGFTEDMQARGMKPDSHLLDFRQLKPPKKVGEKLALTENASVLEIRRIRFADKQPMALETTYVPPSLVPGFTAEDANRSLYDYIEKVSRKTIDHADQTLEATLVTPEDAVLLDLPKGSPVLLIERLSWLKEGTACEFTKSLYRADRYKFVIHVSKK
ncbi:MAG: GntR family transcriptional regulator [Sporolactobacillus sp.]|jgi:GntR family transcriptional regulator|nr:GntR family transcriptional regulator [Sporolactobacillus sp.]